MAPVVRAARTSPDGEQIHRAASLKGVHLKGNPSSSVPFVGLFHPISGYLNPSLLLLLEVCLLQATEGFAALMPCSSCYLTPSVP